MGADEIGILRPKIAVRIVVAKENMDKEGSVNCEVLDTDIGDIFTVMLGLKTEGLVFPSD